jgi:uncharacterized OB-fold protein
MIISGQLITRLSKKFRKIVNVTGVVHAVSSVSIGPKEFGLDRYGVCIIEFGDGSKGEYQIAKGQLLSIGDNVKIVLRFGFEDERGLRFYLPKAVKHE